MVNAPAVVVARMPPPEVRPSFKPICAAEAKFATNIVKAIARGRLSVVNVILVFMVWVHYVRFSFLV